MALVDMHVDMAERAAGEVGRQARYASGATPRRGDEVRPAGGYGELPACELDPVGGAL